jgi:hypothetical protein
MKYHLQKTKILASPVGMSTKNQSEFFESDIVPFGGMTSNG